MFQIRCAQLLNHPSIFFTKLTQNAIEPSVHVCRLLTEARVEFAQKVGVVS